MFSNKEQEERFLTAFESMAESFKNYVELQERLVPSLTDLMGVNSKVTTKMKDELADLV